MTLGEAGRTKRKVCAIQSEPTVSIVIPAKNEVRNLPHVFAGLPSEIHEVILVDGDSTDGTVNVARRLRPDIIIVGQTRKGKGNALACGFSVATGDFIVMLDADGSNNPAEIPRFVNALREGADFAKGSRFMPGAGSSDISRIRQFGNFWLNKIVNYLYGTRYTDLCYGYNAFRRECLSVIDLEAGEPDETDDGMMQWGDGFEVETLINVRIAKAHLRVAEVAELRAEPPLRRQQPERVLRRISGPEDDPCGAQARISSQLRAVTAAGPGGRDFVVGDIDTG